MEVHSQTEFPYVSFRGENLLKHSYVDLTLVGTDTGDPGNIVRCHTDLDTCCTGQGQHRGDWYFPINRTRLQFSNSGDSIYEQRGDKKVELRRRNNATSPSGMYRCDIPTNAVHHETDVLSVRDTVYVGLYATGGI